MILSLLGKTQSPAFELTVEGASMTARLEKRLISLTLTDNRGFEADQLTVELDDADGKIVLPRRGVKLNLALGWKGEPLVEKGSFVVDEIEHVGTPDKLIIRARSADFRETLNLRREASFHEKSLGDIVNAIAARHQLKVALDPIMEKIHLSHIDQTNESDGSFLQRLAGQQGAVAAIKNGHLLFFRQGQGKTALGRAFPVLTLTRQSGDQHRFAVADRGAYSGVMACWLNTRKPRQEKALLLRKKPQAASASSSAKQGDYFLGAGGNVLVLSHTYANEENAASAAKSAWGKIQRGVAGFSLQLARGRADITTEMPIRVIGFKEEIDKSTWLVSQVTHQINEAGFTTALAIEVRILDREI